MLHVLITTVWSWHEVLFNILVEFGVCIQLIRLIKNVFKWNYSENPDWQTFVRYISYSHCPERCSIAVTLQLCFRICP